MTALEFLLSFIDDCKRNFYSPEVFIALCVVVIWAFTK